MTTTTLHAITKPIILAAIALVAPLVSNAQAAEAGFTLKDQPGEYLDVLGDGKIIGRYMYAYDPSKLEQTYKPYLHVFDAEGKGPITKGPGGVFPHHRGIFIGWNKIHVGDKMYDRWHMKGGAQIHQKFLTQKADAKSAVIASRVDWMDDASKPFLEEERTMTFLPPPAPAHAFIDITFRLKAVAGETKLEGDSQHAGVQYRPANELIKQETVYVFPKENASPDKDRDYPWVGETYTLNGKRYSVVYLNHPANPKETVFSATRDYGRFGAYFKTVIAKGGEQVIRTAFLISEGEMPPVEWIQKNYNQFAGTSDPAPKVTVRKIEPPKPKAPPASATPVPPAQ